MTGPTRILKGRNTKVTSAREEGLQASGQMLQKYPWRWEINSGQIEQLPTGS